MASPRVSSLTAQSVPSTGTGSNEASNGTGTPGAACGVLHLVELTWKPGVATDSVEGLTRDLNAMANKLEMITYFSCGPALHVRPGGADYAIIVGVRSEQDLLEYLEHPLHKATLKRWAADMVEDKQSVQIEAALPHFSTLLDPAGSLLETSGRKVMS